MIAKHPWILLVFMNNSYDWSAQFHIAEARQALGVSYFCVKSIHI
jgi:hypothetical protein